MLLLEDAGKRVDEAVIRYKDADRRVLQMNTFLREEILSLISKTKTLFTALELPPVVDNRNKCKSCNFREVCADQDKLKTLLIDAESRLKKGK